MNHAVVVDASVAIKRVLAEEFTEQVQALFANCLNAHRPIFAPPLLPGEVTNALYQRVRTTVATRRVTEDEANRALAAFLRLPITLSSPADLYPRAFALARAYGLPSAYDSIYVALAQITNTELWTGDQRLLRAISTAAPWVRWIGDFK